MKTLITSPKQRTKVYLFLAALLIAFIAFYISIPAISRSLEYLDVKSPYSENVISGINENQSLIKEIRLLEPHHLMEYFGKDLIVIEVSEATEVKFVEGVKQIDQSIIVEGNFRSILHFQFGLDTLRSNCRIRSLKLSKSYKKDLLKGEFQFTCIHPN